MIKKFIRYYKDHMGLLILDIICALFISGTDLVFPMVTRKFMNEFIPDKQIDLIFRMGLILLFLYIFRMILEYIVGYYGHLLGVRMEYDMRKEIFSHVEQLPFRFFDNNKTGHIMSRIVNDLNEISELAHHGPEDILISIIMLIGSFILLMGINVPLTLITFTIIPFMICFAVLYNSKMRKTFRKVRESLADVNAKVEDSISGIRIVKSFTNEEYENIKFDEGNDYFKRMRGLSVKNLGIFHGGMNFFGNASVLIALVAGGYFVTKGKISYGDFAAYILFINQFMQPVRKLADFIEQFQRGMAGFKRFIEVMEINPDIMDKKDAVSKDKVNGEVIFKNVSFSYDNKEHVLNNINLKVNPGETVAIVGPSGAGKTTLCSLIPRFYEIDEGSITLDEADIRDIKISNLRKNIGMVSQDVFLFSGTVRENIAYGDINATEVQIIEAAKKANAHEFIDDLKDGYDTYIGERGVMLSGGQKQRISIARMFLKNPPVLILDEATSSLDNKSEAIIQESVEKLSQSRTTFIIAHRLATIKNAKRILVLTENGIEEEGTHGELLEKHGVYYSLYNAQFR